MIKITVNTSKVGRIGKEKLKNYLEMFSLLNQKDTILLEF